MKQRPRIDAWSQRWSDDFAELGARLRAVLGEHALRIDHIGSTSVEGLAAKDVIDVQVTVADLEIAGLEEELGRAGLRLRTDIVGDHRPPGADGPDADWQKRYADEGGGDGGRPAHVHIRREGSANQRYALLFRDYLRAHPHAAEGYERAKRALAELALDTGTYADAKDPVCDLVMIAAEEWAAATDWEPGSSDA